MIARFDHRPMLTALLALSTTVLLVVVITLATLLITAVPPQATSASERGDANPPAAAVAGTGENYGSMWIAPNPTQKGASVAPHQDAPSARYGF